MRAAPGMRRLTAAALTPEAFAEFGSVIDAAAAAGRPVNDGTATAFGPLAELDVESDAGVPAISIFRARPTTLPCMCACLERHPLSCQAFVSLAGARFLIVVAPYREGEAPDPARTRAFLSDGRQGVHYRRGVWHHALLALDRQGDFLMIGRSGPGRDLEHGRFAGGRAIAVDIAGCPDRPQRTGD